LLKKINDIIYYSRILADQCGRWIVFVCFVGVVAGVGLGISEILFGLGLEQFLSSYGILVRENEHAEWLSINIDPLYFVLIIGVVLTIFRYFSLYIPNLVLQLYMMRIRRLISDETLREEGDISELSVANVSHIMVNLAPGVANLINTITSILLAIFRLFVLLAGIVVLSNELSAIAIAAIFVFGLPAILIRKYYSRISVLAFNESASYSKNIIRNVRNVLLLKLSGQVTTERDKLKSNNTQLYKHMMAYIFVHTGNMVWPNLISIFVVVLVVVTNYEEEFIAKASLIPFVFFLSRISAAISDITSGYGRYQLYKPIFMDFCTYNTLLFEERDPDKKGKDIDISDPIRFCAESLGIGRKNELLSDININLIQGDMLLVSGDSGAGKTTFIYTIMGLIKPIKGRVLWNDTDLKDINQQSFRPHISYSGSDPFLFDGSIEDNIRLGQKITDRKDGDIEKAFEIAACDFVYKQKENILHLLKEGGEGISAGQKQRLSLARALLREPKVLLLDEATSNIDTATEKNIFENMRKYYPDMIVIMISHRDTLKNYATKILEI
jgi:ABC-type bacteriocin/lantibiotic exporter with double-glycine peptidase domain